VVFETTFLAGERQRTYALDRAACGIGLMVHDKILHFLNM